MAYSHAWGLVNRMNHLAGEELVGRTYGGKRGGRRHVVYIAKKNASAPGSKKGRRSR